MPDRAGRNRSAAEKIRAQRAAAQQRRRRRWLLGAAAGAAAIAAAVALTVTLTSGTAGGSNSATPGAAAIGTIGPEGVPIPPGAALAGTQPTGQPVDGISCQTREQTLFHIHAHLTIFVNGKPAQVPAGIGIPGAQPTATAQGPFIGGGDCFYWLHTHAADGIIHIESPVQRIYTLGQFFDLWGQPLSTTQVGPAAGHVTTYLNGSGYDKDPRTIPLTAHAQIQLTVGSPSVSPVSITFPGGL
jgi:hypothetical protein